MLLWLLALAGGLGVAWLSYREVSLIALRRAPLVALRALALALVIALLVDAPGGPARGARPFVALDASASWRRASDPAAWREARARARAMHPDTLWLFGDSLRPDSAPDVPEDAASRARPAADRARAAGRPLVLITDGELDDGSALGDLPAGSRLEIVARPALVDAAVLDVDAPPSTVAGDSIEVRATLRAGARAVPGIVATLRFGGVRAVSRIDSLPANAEREVRWRVVAPDGPARAVLLVEITAAGEVEPRNDSAAVVVEIARAAGAVFVSTAPDEEIRYLVPVLRGALSLPARGFYRVAPGRWRRDGALAPASDDAVRAAMRAAPLVILHGDTALFGDPRRATNGALLLMPAGDAVAGEWYAMGAPASPVAAPLAGAPWDSLPPLVASARAPAGDFPILAIARARRFDARSAIAGSERGRRAVVVGATGFWRWNFRAGASAEVYAALWGGILDWLAAERRDRRAAFPEPGLVRAGAPVRWRRGSSSATGDLGVRVVLARREGARVDTVLLHFAPGSATTESAPLAAGTYDVLAPGGTSLLMVNPSAEWMARAPTVRAGALSGAPARGEAPPLRDRGAIVLFVIAALCAEWLLRRRAGLR